MLLVRLKSGLDFQVIEVRRQVTCLFELHLLGDTDGGDELAVHLSVQGLISSNFLLNSSELLGASSLEHDVWLGDLLPFLPGTECGHSNSA